MRRGLESKPGDHLDEGGCENAKGNETALIEQGTNRIRIRMECQQRNPETPKGTRTTDSDYL